MSLIKKVSVAVVALSVAIASFPAMSEGSNLIQTGDVVGKHIFGLGRDVKGDPLLVGSDPVIYSKSTGTEYLNVGESEFRVDVFDEAIANVYISDIDKASKLIVDTKSLPLGPIGGVHGISYLSKSSWNTLLFSESRHVNSASPGDFEAMFKPYFKGNVELVKPYQYGWLNEVIVLNSKGDAKAIKTFAAGRLFASSFAMMPDNKTVYFHDQVSGHLYVFIAEDANSLAKGVLYVVSNGGTRSLIELGKSSALKMKFKLKKASFGKFFKELEVVEGGCSSGFTFISTVFGEECLKAQKKNRKYLGQFEPIRMAAIKGVKPVLPQTALIKLDRNKNEIIVVDNDRQEKRYLLEKDEAYGSDFVIRGL